MTNPNFDQGRSTGEREGSPAYGAPDEVNHVSDDMDKYQGVAGLLPTDVGNRYAPIRGRATIVPIPGTHGNQVVNGTGVVTSPTNRQIQDLVLERMAQNVSTAQYDHSHTIAVQRPGGKQDFPDGTGRSKIHATLQYDYGLGDAYARPGPSGHDPGEDDSVAGDYLRDQDPLAKYGNGILSARGTLGPQDYGSGFPRDPVSQFPTVGDDLLAGFQQREATLAASYIPRTKPAAPVSNRLVGQSSRGQKRSR